MSALSNELRLAGDEFSILFVDDDPGIRALVDDLLNLKLPESEVTVTGRANEGFSYASEQKFDCIVLDYHMPRMTGVEFIKRLRETGDSTPIILYTSVDESDVPDGAFEYLLVDYLKKAKGAWEELIDRIIYTVTVEERSVSSKIGKQLFEEAGDADEEYTWFLNLNGQDTVHFCGFEDLVGESADCIREHPAKLFEFIPETDHSRVKTCLEALKEGEAVMVDHQLRGVNGVISVRSTAFPVAEGRSLRAVGSLVEISECELYEPATVRLK